ADLAPVRMGRAAGERRRIQAHLFGVTSMESLANARVLVTGGTGFIGGRLIERLVLQHGAHVRVLVRRYDSATRAARLPVELIGGDVTHAADVERAMTGCDYVFHCAYANAG